MEFNLDILVRENIKNLVPYSSARDDFGGEANIFLDANENSLGSPAIKFFPAAQGYNRYPDPHQSGLKEKLSSIKGIPPVNTFLGNGSDECIDLLIRAFCEPGIDNIITCPPTYGMYEVCARINNAGIKKINLTPGFQLNLVEIENAVDGNTKIIFLCSPNNPTGNSLHYEDISFLLNNYFGLVVIDEAYINFSRQKSLAGELADYPNLVVLQTLSKAWGLAALRVGITYASEKIIRILNKIKPPYNISLASQQIAMQALNELDQVNGMIREIVKERAVLEQGLQRLSVVEKIYPSDANFLLVKVKEPVKIYKYLLNKGIVVRDRSKAALCDGCLRITVGTVSENKILLKALEDFEA